MHPRPNLPVGTFARWPHSCGAPTTRRRRTGNGGRAATGACVRACMRGCWLERAAAGALRAPMRAVRCRSRCVPASSARQIRNSTPFPLRNPPRPRAACVRSHPVRMNPRIVPRRPRPPACMPAPSGAPPFHPAPTHPQGPHGRDPRVSRAQRSGDEGSTELPRAATASSPRAFDDPTKAQRSSGTQTHHSPPAALNPRHARLIRS
jgi:hypothetical protein